MAGATPKLIKELREKTGAGMLDCKKALNETNGDIEKAMQYLREAGLAKAAKKSGNVAAEGAVSIEISEDFKSGIMVEINSQTDFVAKNEKFKELSSNVLNQIKTTNVNTIEELNQTSIDGVSFEEYIKTQIAVIGENLVVRRFAKVSTNEGVVNGYVHLGKVGVLLAAKCSESVKDKAVELLKKVAMHAASMKPTVISYKDFTPEFIESENKAIIEEIKKENEERARLGKPLLNVPEYVSMAQLSDEAIEKAKAKMKEELLAEGKPEKVIEERILPGKIKRWIEDNTQLDKRNALLSQTYVMDDSKTVEEAIKEVDESIEIVEYIRFELGEGIEKKEEDFAAEVAKQMGK